ncbi:hypothetical protein RJT34_17265 [Clitoria ternatea]|uniref:Uncharacterized protein n=1 Tax=Clitoria ternatea TaxID=43366 RepID=A0AAN9JA93_CLITE
MRRQSSHPLSLCLLLHAKTHLPPSIFLSPSPCKDEAATIPSPPVAHSLQAGDVWYVECFYASSIDKNSIVCTIAHHIGIANVTFWKATSQNYHSCLPGTCMYNMSPNEPSVKLG